MVLRKNQLWSGPKMILLVITWQSLGLHQNMGRACSVSGCFGPPVIQGVPSVGATLPEDWLVRQFPRNLGGQEARLVRMMITTLMGIWMEMVTCNRGKKWTPSSNPKVWFSMTSIIKNVLICFLWMIFLEWLWAASIGSLSFKFRVWMTLRSYYWYR